MTIKSTALQQWWRERQVPDLSLQQWGELIPLLRRQQMLARFALRCNLLASPIPEYARRHITNACRLAEKQLGQVHYEAQCLQAISGHRHRIVYLKGAAYSLAGRDAGLGRTYSDIDLLVPAAELNEIEFELLLHGYVGEELDPYDDMYYRRWAHEIPPLKHAERGTVLDVHHQLLPPISGRAPDLMPFWQSIQATAEGYWVLGPAAMYLHSAIHLFCNEEIKHGFRDITDLALLAEEFDSPEFWQELIGLATRSGFASELWLSVDQLRIQGVFELPLVIRQWWLAYPATVSQRYLWRAMYTRVLSPEPCAAGWRFVLALRGHWLKMPLSVLCKHTVAKVRRAVVNAMFGDAWSKPSH